MTDPRADTHHARPVRAPRRLPARVGLAALATAIGVLTAAAPATAHVLIESVDPHPDGTSTVTFTFEHGCDGEPTRALTVTVPDGVDPLTTAQPEGWSAAIHSRQVHWHGDPVPDGQHATFTLDIRVTGTVGQTYAFPTEQECTTGTNYWTETEPSSPYPAPTFVATAATLTPAPAAPGATPLPTAPLLAGILAASAGIGLLGARATQRHHHHRATKG